MLAARETEHQVQFQKDHFGFNEAIEAKRLVQTGNPGFEIQKKMDLEEIRATDD